jgi:hypothetical protein
MVKKPIMNGNMQNILHIQCEGKFTYNKVEATTLGMPSLTNCYVKVVINYVVVYPHRWLNTNWSYNISKSMVLAVGTKLILLMSL